MGHGRIQQEVVILVRQKNLICNRHQHRRRNALALDVNFAVGIHSATHGKREVLAVGHHDALDASAEPAGGVVADDVGAVVNGHVIGEKLAGAQAERANNDGHFAVIAKVFGRQVVAVLPIRIEVEFAAVLVIVPGIAKGMRLLEKVGSHLVREKAAAAPILAHVNDQPVHSVSLQRADHPLPQLDGQHTVVGEAVDLDVTVVVLAVIARFQQLVIDRDLKSGRSSGKGGKAEALKFADHLHRFRYFLAFRVLPGQLDLCLDREAGGVAHLLQTLEMTRAERRGVGDRVADRIGNRDTVNGNDLGPERDAGCFSRAAFRYEVDDYRALFSLPYRNAQAARYVSLEILADERPAYMAVRDRPAEVAQRPLVLARVLIRVRGLEAGQELSPLCLPVDSLIFRERILFDHQVYQRVERLRVGLVGVVYERNALRFDQIDDRVARPVETEWFGIHVDQCVTLRQGHDRIIFRKEQPIFAKAGWKALLVIRRVNKERAANNLAFGLNLVTDAGRSIGR